MEAKITDDIWEYCKVTGLNVEGAVVPAISVHFAPATQKPQALVERIIESSSNEGDVVLDPFCGCGTAIEAAHHLGRGWIGIDITHLAVGLIKYRLQNAFGDEVKETYDVIGEPVTVHDACQLAEENPRIDPADRPDPG